MERASKIQPDQMTGWLVGERFGSYEIESLLGSGGMGEVYRARDTTLGRDVAIKILPAIFTADANRRARFEREARVLAALNHPHIGAIYGFEHRDEIHALVLELVEGETLAERLRPGPVPMREALAIARQIAEALEAAHEKGIIHRDLKPANITLTREGVVKVLDFGLAKAGVDESDPQSPTLTEGGTHDGVILGTAAYMSPEQARGKVVDKRTDIWAFGAVLYETLTGRTAFAGDTMSDTIAAILDREPAWDMLPASIPDSVRRLLQRCVEKDPKRRLHDIADARLEIDDALATVRDEPAFRRADPKRATPSRATAALLVISLVATTAAIAIGLARYRAATSSSTLLGLPHADAIVVQFQVPAPDDSSFGTLPVEPHPALSADGKRLAFVANASDGTRLLWIRDLDSLAARPLAGTSGVTGTPFWSPDGRFVGFIAQGQLKKIRPAGGPPQTLCAAPGAVAGSWSRHDDILFATLEGDGLRRVSAAGGTPARVTELDQSRQETSHRYPQFLPDGRRFMFLIRSTNPDHRGNFVGSLDSRERKRVLADDAAVMYEPPSASSGYGHLLYVRDTTLLAQSFDADRLELGGEAVPVADGVPLAPTVRKSPFSVAGGTLVYRDAGPQISQLVWVDRTGTDLGKVGGPDVYKGHRLSPNARQIAITIFDRQTLKANLWIFDLASGIKTRLTFAPDDVLSPVWSPDATRLAFNSNRLGNWNVYTKELTVSAPEELLFKFERSTRPGPGNTYLQQWSADGRWLVFSAGDLMTGIHLWALPLDSRKPVLAVPAEFNEDQGRLSPDSRWIAYASDESGAREIYIQRFPSSGRKLRISAAGGREPQWRGDGEELFFIAGDGTLMAAPIRGKETLEIGTPRALFSLGPQRGMSFAPYGMTSLYDVTNNGRRFLVQRLVDANARSAMTVVLNWTAGLKR